MGSALKTYWSPQSNSELTLAKRITLDVVRLHPYHPVHSPVRSVKGYDTPLTVPLLPSTHFSSSDRTVLIFLRQSPGSISSNNLSCTKKQYSSYPTILPKFCSHLRGWSLRNYAIRVPL